MKKDKAKIIETVNNVVTFVDEHKWQELENIFADKVLLDYSSFTGQDAEELTGAEIVNRWSSFLPGFNITQHKLTNYNIKIEKDIIKVKTDVRAIHYIEKLKEENTWIVDGSYDFELIEVEGEFKVKLMRLNFEKTIGNNNLPNIALEKMKKEIKFESQGEELAGNIYYPEDYKEGKKYPAIIVTGAWTTVKEQMPTTYAKELAKKGFITFVFDFRGWGESSGDLKYLEDPIRKTEDIVSAVNYLKTRKDISKVAGLGICASSGYMVKAFSEGKFDSIALVAPWLHNKEIATQVYGGEESVNSLIDLGDKAQKNFEKTGESQVITAASSTDKNSLMYQAPYYTEESRGLIAQYDNKFNVASWRPWLTFDAIKYANKLPGKILFVESEAMALPQGSLTFKEIAGNKIESINFKNVTQFEFYDRANIVEKSVNAVADFMKKELK